MPNRIELDEDDFRRRWERGDRLADIAEHFGIGQSTASKRASLLGLPPRYAKSGSPRAKRATSGSSPSRLSNGRWVRRGAVLRWVSR